MNYCKQCGAELEERTVVCSLCGFNNENNPEFNQAEAQQNYEQPYQEQYQQNYQQNYQQQQYQQNYQQPPYQPVQDKKTAPLSVGEILVTIILMSIPIVNIVMLIVWLTNKDTNLNKRNFAIAMLILECIGIALYVILFIIMAAMGVSIMSMASLPMLFL